MEFTTLGRTGLTVSRLCLGTMNFGPKTSEPDSYAIMDRALEHEINFFDTADVYGWKTGEGYTEQILGRWLAQGGGRRDKVVLATKVYGRMSDWPNDRGLSARHLIKACDDSLRRLQTDWIDLYQMHHVDRTTPWEEIWQAMEILVTSGKVRYVGSSNFAGWHLASAQEAAKSRHFLGLVSEQCIYNLFERTVELEVIPAAQHYGIGIIPWSPLHGGLLSGVLKRTKEGTAARASEQGGRSSDALAEHRTTVEAYEKLAESVETNPADLALAWLLSRDGVTAPIIGPRTLEQLDNSLRSLEVTLDSETLSRLDELFPPVGNGGPGPEAWAW
jgi:NDP-hexose 2,3-enoyl reductase